MAKNEGQSLTSEQLNNFWSVADINGDGKLSFEEYMKVMMPGVDGSARTVFNTFDTNGDGFLDYSEMAQVRKMKFHLLWSYML